jgi:protein disulfide-isomerase A6
MPPLSMFTVLTALLGLVNADGIYTKNSPVLQVNAKSYDRLIAQSNHTSVSRIFLHLTTVADMLLRS